MSSSRISPTAHYTGHVWRRHDLAPPELGTRTGRLLYYAAQPLMAASRARGGHSIEDVLLARHRIIDHLLERAIKAGEVGQVVEIAAGLSSRGHRFMERASARAGLTYIEGDLPGMLAQKRARLAALGPLSPGHHLVELDALADSGPRSLAAVAERLLDPTVGTAVVVEGLINYFDRATVARIWARIHEVLCAYPAGRYLGDIYVRANIRRSLSARLFSRLLSIFARGQVHIHFATMAEAASALTEAGFASADVHMPHVFADALALSPLEATAPVCVASARARSRAEPG